MLFGDGAGELILRAEQTESGILTTLLHADGRHNDLFFVDGGPSTTGTVGKLRMKGREVFRHAVVNLAGVMNEVLAAAGLTSDDVDWLGFDAGIPGRQRPLVIVAARVRAHGNRHNRRQGVPDFGDQFVPMHVSAIVVLRKRFAL